jgi:lipid-A-disaccharide synthase
MAKKIFIIAGEESGDNIGAKIITAIKKQSKQKIEFYGIGGDKMAKTGLKSLFPMKELSLLGFLEIIPHLPKVFKRIKQTVEKIAEIQPDILVTIDSPGFNKRVAKQVKGSNTKLVHIVAPSVWAYRPARAQKFAEIFDKLLCLLPIEPKYFEKEGLESKFIGHPIFEDIPEFSKKEIEGFRKKHSLKTDDVIISTLIGSRKGEIKKHLPIFCEAIEILRKKYHNLKVIIPTTKQHKIVIEEYFKSKKIPVIITDNMDEKFLGFEVSNAAIVKSGTVSLEVAAKKCPMVIAYKVNPISAYLLRKKILIKYVTLINILQDKPIIPEYLQEECTSDNLAIGIMNLIDDKKTAEAQTKQSEKSLNFLGMNQKEKPSSMAAKYILETLKR